ncbi:MAG TPA: DUF4262 domain-containing protein, partial [Phenylobacterium sp.]
MFEWLTLSRLEREVLRAIKSDGWTTVPIEGPDITWHYSVGLLDHGLPELITFVYPGDFAAKLIYQAQLRVRDGRFKPADGLHWTDPDSDWECRWRRVHHSQHHFNWFLMAKWYHHRRTGRREHFDVYQLVHPDAEHRYPWEEGFDEALRQ